MTYSQNFSDRFSAGMTAKFLFDQLGDANGKAFAVDFGTNYHAMLGSKPIRMGFTVSNLGSGLNYSGAALTVQVPHVQPTGEDEVPTSPQPGTLQSKAFPLPTTFRVSLGYDLLNTTSKRFSLLGEFNQPNNNRAGYAVGGEYALNRVGGTAFGLALRGSYSAAPANDGTNDGLTGAVVSTVSEKSSLQGLAGGGGISYSSGNFNLGLDYAVKYMGVLGPTNFFSVTLGW